MEVYIHDSVSEDNISKDFQHIFLKVSNIISLLLDYAKLLRPNIFQNLISWINAFLSNFNYFHEVPTFFHQSLKPTLLVWS